MIMVSLKSTRMKHFQHVPFFLLFLLCTNAWAQNSWSTGPDLPAPVRVSPIGFAIGSKGYIGLGGESNTTFYHDIWEFDPGTGQYTAKDNYPGVSTTGVSVFVIGTKAYVGMGSTSRDFWEFDPSKATGQQWTQKADYPGSATYALTAMLIGSFGYAGIGDDSNRQWWRYDPVANSWTRKADYPGMWYPYYSGFAIGNKGYVLDEGGSTAVSIPFIMEYDPGNDNWTQRASFPQKRTNAITFVIDGRGYFGGGSSPNAPGQCFNDFYEYDPIEDVVVRKADIAGAARETSYAFALNGKGYSGAGYEFFGGYFKDMRIYTPESINCGVAVRTKCQGDIIQVNYNTPGLTLNAGNTIKVELSNATGSFASPTVIGTLTTNTSSGVVNATIPAGTPAGTGYRVRVKSSNTAATSFANNSDIKINAVVTPTINLTANPGASVVLGTSVKITANITNGGSNPQYAWTRNGTAFGLNKSTLDYSDYLNGDVIKCTLTSNAVCASSTTANSNTITMTISPNRPGDTWTKKADLTGGGRSGASAFSIGGKAYVGMGSAAGYVNDMWEYDPGSNTWTQKASAPESFGNAATWVIGDKAYFSAAFYGVPTQVTYAFDPVANTWTRKADFPGTGRFLHSYFTINGKGYVCGGNGLTNGNQNSEYLRDVWEYDPQNDTWTRKADMPTVRIQSFGFSINGKGYIGGGGDSSGPSGLHPLTDLIEYDPAANTWTKKADIPGANNYQAWVAYGTATSVDGKGYVSANNDAHRFLEYDPLSDSWSEKPSTPIGGSGSSMFAIGSKVYLCCGFDGGSTSAQLWSYTPDMISLSAIPASCPGDVRQVKWSTGKFIALNGGNIFTVQLSDAAGSFNSPVTIGTATSSATTGTVQVTFPSTLAAGTYRMRIVASNPSYVSSSMSSAILPLSTAPATTISLESNIGNTIYSYSVPYLNATVTNEGIGPTYVWKKNGQVVQGAPNFWQFGPHPNANGDSYTCTITAGLACALPVESNAVVFTVVSGPSLITTNPINGNFCAGATIDVGYTSGIIFPANTTLEVQLSKTYTFANPQVIGTLATTAITGKVSATIPADVEGGSYRIRVMQSGAQSNWIDAGINISSATSTVSITSDPNGSVCAGASVTFTATSGEGVTPDYQWKINGNNVGTNSANFITTALVDNDVVSVSMTSKSGCSVNPNVTSNELTMAVKPSSTPSVTIEADKSLTGCIGDPITFTATAVNAGSQPTYQWVFGATSLGFTKSVKFSPQEMGFVNCRVTVSDGCTTKSSVVADPLLLAPRSKPQAPVIMLSLNGHELTTTTNGAGYVYDWYRDNVKLSSTAATLPFSDAGTYKVQVGVFGSTCMSDLSPDFKLVFTGDIDDVNSSITFFPNPVEDRLTIQTPGAGRKEISIYQMNGRITADLSTTAESEDIDVRNYSPGIYLLLITNSDGATVGKFLKK
jgi:N-acetylneuraminic acid mutarotase